MFMLHQVVSEPNFEMARQGNDDGDRLTRLEQGVEGTTRSIEMLTELVRGVQDNASASQV